MQYMTFCDDDEQCYASELNVIYMNKGYMLWTPESYDMLVSVSRSIL